MGLNRDSNRVFIEVKDLTHIYNNGKPGECRALSSVDLEVGKEEFLAIVGPNGSGKSTLARHFNALLLPTEGKVLVDGLDTSRQENVWEVRRRVGMVFQNPDNQIVSSLVEEDVAFGAENLSLPPDEVRARVEEALDFSGLTPFRQHPPHLLSGGQKQRLAIAGILAMGPSCLVLDEPSAMLDPAGRKELMQTLIRLSRQRGVTVALVTHFMEEAAQADRVVVMSGGRKVLEGAPVQIFQEETLLSEIGLDPPPAAAIARGLRARGLTVPQDILTLDDLASCLGDATPGGTVLRRKLGDTGGDTGDGSLSQA